MEGLEAREVEGPEESPMEWWLLAVGLLSVAFYLRERYVAARRAPMRRRASAHAPAASARPHSDDGHPWFWWMHSSSHRASSSHASHDRGPASHGAEGVHDPLPEADSGGSDAGGFDGGGFDGGGDAGGDGGGD